MCQNFVGTYFQLLEGQYCDKLDMDVNRINYVPELMHEDMALWVTIRAIAHKQWCRSMNSL